MQNACGADPFNNLWDDGTFVAGSGEAPKVDYAAHAAALGAHSEYVSSLEGLKPALERAIAADTTALVAIDTNAVESTGGGTWWQVGIPEVSERKEVLSAREEWQESGRKEQAF